MRLSLFFNLFFPEGVTTNELKVLYCFQGWEHFFNRSFIFSLVFVRVRLMMSYALGCLNTARSQLIKTLIT